LFYDRFQYSVGFRLQEASCLRELDHNYISTTIERRKTWREIAQQRWNTINKKGGIIKGLAGRRYNEITDEIEQNLHDFVDVLFDSGVEFKLVVSTDYGWIYTNDVVLIEQLKQLKMLTSKLYTEAIVDRPKNTIRLKNSKHQLRSYFKTIKMTAQQKINLINFLNNQADTIRVSPALNSWIDGPFHRTQDYFFVDYDKELWLTMLALVHPGLIRKTQQIIPAK
jgi:hypothetical protein